MIVSHGGKLGDLIYSLPAMEALATEKRVSLQLVLYPNAGTGTTFTPETLAFLYSLLMKQPYIESVSFTAIPYGWGRNLDGWRNAYPAGVNLAQWIRDYTLGLPYGPVAPGWLRGVEPYRVAPVVVSRSMQYRSPAGDAAYRELMDKRNCDAVFIGTFEEYQDFTRRFVSITRYLVNSALDLARAIAGSELFIGNQSFPRALAEGLGHPLIGECCPERAWDNCRYPRENAAYV